MQMKVYLQLVEGVDGDDGDDGLARIVQLHRGLLGCFPQAGLTAGDEFNVCCRRRFIFGWSKNLIGMMATAVLPLLCSYTGACLAAFPRLGRVWAMLRGASSTVHRHTQTSRITCFLVLRRIWA